MYLPLQVEDFIAAVGGLYGLKPETLDSLILDFLPRLRHDYVKLEDDKTIDSKQEVSVYLFQEVLKVLRCNAGFHIPEVRPFLC